jgi:hypothetical protein
MVELVAAAVCGIVVGITLGLTGGGGSVFAMPLLIYGLRLPAGDAVPVALAAVALMALTGALFVARQRLPVWPAALMFAFGGVLGAPAGLMLARRMAEVWIVLGFSALALTVGATMWWRSLVRSADAVVVRARPAVNDAGGACRLSESGELRFTAPCAGILAVAGLGTGFLSGLFGVGGGFLIVPVLVSVTRMGIHRAVATSLVALSAIGLAGAAGAMLGGDVEWSVLVPFGAGGVAGMFAGRALAARLAGVALQRVFATAILLVALWMAIITLRS